MIEPPFFAPLTSIWERTVGPPVAAHRRRSCQQASSRPPRNRKRPSLAAARRVQPLSRQVRRSMRQARSSRQPPARWSLRRRASGVSVALLLPPQAARIAVPGRDGGPGEKMTTAQVFRVLVHGCYSFVSERSNALYSCVIAHNHPLTSARM